MQAAAARSMFMLLIKMWVSIQIYQLLPIFTTSLPNGRRESVRKNMFVVDYATILRNGRGFFVKNSIFVKN